MTVQPLNPGGREDQSYDDKEDRGEDKILICGNVLGLRRKAKPGCDVGEVL